MNFIDINKEIKNHELTLKPISSHDRDFIYSLFQDRDISKYYIVPKEAQQDHKRLIDYWLNDNKNGAGTCWIIFFKTKDFFSNDKVCGFVAFEFRDTLKNARVSYAIHPNFRRKGIATKATELVIARLKEQGVLTVEADIDRDNSYSEKVVEKLGFRANKHQALIDPEMLRDGEIRMRALWKKHLVEIDPNDSSDGLSINATSQEIIPLINRLVEEINSKGQHPELMLRYFYLLGRIKFIEGNYEEARAAFGQSNMMVGRGEFPDTHLYFYWLGKINEIENKPELAISCFEQAIEKFNIASTDITKNDIERALKTIKS